MANRRKPPRKRQPSDYDMILWASALAALIFTLCLCAFNFELTAKGKTAATVPRLEICRSTCDERLQSAALESSIPLSMASSAIDSLFLRRDVDQNTTLRKQRDPSRAASPDDFNVSNLVKSSQVRPRRLPGLIKILTGFSDEPYWSNFQSLNGQKPIIARIEKPILVPPATRRRRGDRLTSEDTVQMAAAAATAAVWSKSIRTFGNNRMRKINAEWDAALRWIAGWDQQVSLNSNFAMNNDNWGTSEAERGVGRGSRNNGDASQSTNNEGFNDFVDDLARLLQSCIVKCLDDETFELGGKRDSGSDGAALGESLIGNFVLRSIFSWVVGSTLPRISFGKLDMISQDSRFFLMGTIHLAVSSIAVYALLSLWTWAMPALFDWYSSFHCTETPEWIIEHEREIELAKNSQCKQKKGASSKKAKKKHSTKQPGNRNKISLSRSESQPNTLGQMRASNECELNTVHDKAILAGETVTLKEKTCDSADTFCEEVWQHTHSTRNKSSNSNVESNVTVAKDSMYQRPIIDGEVPSSGSLSSASTSTSSPIVKPIGSRNEEQIIPDTSPLGGTSRPIIGWNSPLDLRSGASPLFPQHRNALPVPTQEQRNEAAKQLREFQSAQIQRILYEKKLAEALKNNLHTTLTAIGDASSSNSFLGNRQVLKPPPGLTQQFVIQNVHDHNNQDDKSFLTDNELFLSKLLDDDDEDVEIPPPRIGIESMLSNEMSLDPSAAPFISERAVVQDAQPSQQSKDERADTWQSSPTTSDSSFEKPLSESSNLKIRGVYGGNVW